MMTNKITVEATIDGELQKIWRFWTQPDHIVKWNFATDDWCCAKAENDLRVGGKMFARMEAKNGSLGFDFEGVYDEVIDQEKITYTLLDGRGSTTIFENLGDHIKVSTTFDAEQNTSIEMQREGWQAILNNFKKYVESN
ncbi:SRPBCC family protein [Gelidibacter mesophilus]|uniref:SRPBCC family protein n=1 Tax=Gelidibacter mesophilus TaxID=169050 RepID=UPI00048959F1|nr:SRPBCC family protein [Gelidibacter mesophilus]